MIAPSVLSSSAEPVVKHELTYSNPGISSCGSDSATRRNHRRASSKTSSGASSASFLSGDTDALQPEPLQTSRRSGLYGLASLPLQEDDNGDALYRSRYCGTGLTGQPARGAAALAVAPQAPAQRLLGWPALLSITVYAVWFCWTLCRKLVEPVAASSTAPMISKWQFLLWTGVSPLTCFLSCMIIWLSFKLFKHN